MPEHGAEEHLPLCEGCRERLKLDNECIATMRQAVEDDRWNNGVGDR